MYSVFILDVSNYQLGKVRFMSAPAISISSSGVYACKICGEAFAQKNELIHHIKEKHGETVAT